MTDASMPSSCSQSDSVPGSVAFVAVPAHQPQPDSPTPVAFDEDVVDGIGRIRCRAVPFADGMPDGDGDEWPVPEWVQLCPTGDEAGVVQGRDGRGFRVTDPDEILKNTEKSMFFDVDHFSLYWDKTTESVGWVSEVEFVAGDDEDDKREPGFWARVRWTKDGRELIASGKFRGISPVVLVRYEQAEDGSLIRPGTAFAFARCAALTNLPNLEMTMLNRTGGRKGGGAEAPINERAPAHIEQESRMDESLIALAAMMGVEAKPGALVEAFSTLKRERDEAKAMAERLQSESQAAEAKRFAADCEREFKAALESKKMLPAEELSFRSMVKSPESLEQFSKIMAARSSALVDDETHDEKTEPTEVVRLTALQKRMAEEAGLSHDEYAEALKEVI